MKKWVMALVSVLVLSAVAACSQQNSPPKANESVQEGAGGEETKAPRVAFVYLGVPGDGGWTYQHDLARQEVEVTFGIKATVVENVPDTADAERVFMQLAEENDIIFGTSYGYMDAMVNTAAKFPDVVFAHSTGYKTADNLATYTGRDYESGYLSGIAAGRMSQSGKLGYVGAFPIPEVINTINGFALGAQSVNPDAVVYVTWSNTWFDPATERQAAISLLDKGVDVLATYQDSPAGIQAAAERGVYGIGNDSDMNKYVPETYITNPVWNFAPYYIDVIQSVMNGTWKSGAYYGGIKDGMLDIAPYGKNVPQEVRDEVDKRKRDIADGKFRVFQGPLYDQASKLAVEEGKTMADGEILAMNWFVKGVQGTIPK